jgi:hypothetical protein
LLAASHATTKSADSQQPTDHNPEQGRQAFWFVLHDRGNFMTGTSKSSMTLMAVLMTSAWSIKLSMGLISQIYGSTVKPRKLWSMSWKVRAT